MFIPWADNALPGCGTYCFIVYACTACGVSGNLQRQWRIRPELHGSWVTILQRHFGCFIRLVNIFLIIYLLPLKSPFRHWWEGLFLCLRFRSIAGILSMSPKQLDNFLQHRNQCEQIKMKNIWQYRACKQRAVVYWWLKVGFWLIACVALRNFQLVVENLYQFVQSICRNRL